ncbi:MAG: hypothetical protein LLG14_00715 [Nocardiaceae bacterium]|nr:hypothetical protein [Nocardiaceae bacterium]
MDIADLFARSQFDELIDTVRERINSDRRALVDPAIKQWCGQRWRDLFLTEAQSDERAVRAATSLLGTDKRPVRQRLAERYLAQDVEDWRLDLPPATQGTIDAALMFCPGFVHRAIPVVGLEDLESVAQGFGSTVVRADAHPARGCEANMADLRAALDSADDADVVMFGYSKGSPDALTLLAHQPDIAGRVRALVCWAGAVGGSPTADDVYGLIKDIEIGPIVGTELVLTALKAMLPIAQLEGMIERPDEWDLRGAIRDLSTTERSRFMAEHGADIDALDIPIFNVVGVARPLEVPYFQMQGSIDIGRRVGPNDMQVAVEHAQVTAPMGTTLAVCRAHHWDLALGPFPLTHRLGSPNLDNPFPRRAAITATVLLLAELGVVVAPER